MQPMTKILKLVFALLITTFSSLSNAESTKSIQDNENEVWINFGMYSLHGDENVALNDNNDGFGV